MRTLIVGVAPSSEHGRGTAFAGSKSATRLERLLGVQAGSLALHYDTANLADEWPGYAESEGDRLPGGMAEAAYRLRGTMAAEGRERAILCGAPVARALGLDFVPLNVEMIGSTKCLLLPHPSGVSRWWNDRPNRIAAARAVDIFEGPGRAGGII